MSLAERISDGKYAAGTEIERTSKQFARAMVPSDRPLSILDVGCGTGVNADQLAAKGHHVTGVDISKVAIEKFTSEGRPGIQCDIAQGAPFPDDTFDLVFASDVIEHLADTESFLAELFRVLRPEGMLLLTTINSAFWPFRLLGLFGRTVTEVQHPGHIRFFSKRGLAQCAEAAGFESVSMAGRNMYVILSGPAAQFLDPLLRRMGFIREIRFRTQKPFWHISHFAKRASALWSEALILTARKPAARP